MSNQELVLLKASHAGPALSSSDDLDDSSAVEDDDHQPLPKRKNGHRASAARVKRCYRTGRKLRRVTLKEEVRVFVTTRLAVAEGEFLSVGDLMVAFKADEGGSLLPDDDNLYFFRELRRCMASTFPGVQSARTWSRRGYRGVALVSRP